MFTGFSDATIDFLWELRFHNERPWFLEHKQVFLDTLDRPMKALAADVTAALEQAYPQRVAVVVRRDRRRISQAVAEITRLPHLPRRAAAARQWTV